MWECKIAPPVITFNIDMLLTQKTVFIMLSTKISMISLSLEVYFQYLVCLNKTLQSLSLHIAYRGKKSRGKVSKFLRLSHKLSRGKYDYIFPD